MTSSTDWIGANQLRPSECRGVIAGHLSKPAGVFVPKQQGDEINAVISHMKRSGQVSADNTYLFGIVSGYVEGASQGNKVFVGPRDLQEQFDVLSEALSIAKSASRSEGGHDKAVASRFVRKTEHQLARVLPKPNIEALGNCQKPFIFTDWLLARSARRVGGIVVSADRDMIFLNEGYERVTGYRPCRNLEHSPLSLSMDEFVASVEDPRFLGNAHHLGGLPVPRRFPARSAPQPGQTHEH